MRSADADFLAGAAGLLEPLGLAPVAAWGAGGARSAAGASVGASEGTATVEPGSAVGAPLVSGNTSCDNTTNFFVGVPVELDMDPETLPAEPVITEGDNDFCEDATE